MNGWLPFTCRLAEKTERVFEDMISSIKMEYRRGEELDTIIRDIGRVLGCACSLRLPPCVVTNHYPSMSSLC